MKYIKSNLLEAIMLVLAKILGMVAVGSAFSRSQSLGLPLFMASFLLIIFVVIKCISKMKLATNTPGEDWNETVELN